MKSPLPPKVAIKPAGRKGEGVFAVNHIRRNRIICEYEGTLIEWTDPGPFPPVLEKTQHSDFCLFFKSKLTRKKYCIDATNSSGPGRKINHSRWHCNVKPDDFEEVKGYPRVFFVARKDIECGDELLFDYGDRDKAVLHHNPWLKE